MNIYLSNETSFDNNGLGFLTDCISAKVEESLNGDYTLNITYALNGKLSEYLVENNIIKCNVGNNNYQLFRIARITKDFDEIEVYALHISYDLLLNILVDTYPQNLTCQAFGNWLLEHTQYENDFTFVSDINNSASARYVRRNPIEAIMGDLENSMINLFGGEVERDNFTFKLLQSRGSNNHVKLMLGKNITEIKTKVDITSLYTRIMPVGFDGLVLPEKFIDSPLLYNYPTPRIIKVNFSDIKYDPESEEEGVYTNIQDAYTALRAAANDLFDKGIDKPIITIDVDWLELSKTEQYKNQYQSLESVRLGDTITASLLDFDYTTKVVKTIYNVLTDTIDSFEIGTLSKSIANTINNNQLEIEKIQPDSILDEAKTNATKLINNALGGYIYLDYENGNLYIMDTDNPSTAQKVWRWNLNGLGYSSTGINGTYGIAMTMDGAIVADFITTGSLNTSVINGYDSLTLQVDTNKSDIATIKAEISDIADITTSAESDVCYIAETNLQNIASSNPIRVEIYPLSTGIQSLYPKTTLYPGTTLYPREKTLRFTNTSTNEVFTYELPVDLLYYDEDNYDSFIADYESDLVTITKKCELDANGNVTLLAEPVVTTYSYTDTFAPYFALTEGNYRVELVGYTSGHIMSRLMVLNAYSAQYATKVELSSSISQTKNDINIEVAKKVNTNEVISKINLSTEGIQISSDKLSLAGKTINMTSDNIAINSTNFQVDKDGNMTCNSGTFGGTISTSENCIIGNDLKVGVNQSASGSDNKYINFTDSTYIKRYTYYGHDQMTIESPAVRISCGENLAFSSNGNFTTIYDSADDFIELFEGTIECNTPIVVRSDKRNKTAIKNIDVNWIKDLKIKEYEYKKNPNKKHIGLIAQDYIGKEYSKYFLNQNKDGYYGIDYSSITNALIQYTQELNKKVEQLEKRVEELEGGK